MEELLGYDPRIGESKSPVLPITLQLYLLEASIGYAPMSPGYKSGVLLIKL